MFQTTKKMNEKEEHIRVVCLQNTINTYKFAYRYVFPVSYLLSLFPFAFLLPFFHLKHNDDVLIVFLLLVIWTYSITQTAQNASIQYGINLFTIFQWFFNTNNLRWFYSQNNNKQNKQTMGEMKMFFNPCCNKRKLMENVYYYIIM